MINTNINISEKISKVPGNDRETVLVVDDDYLLRSLGRDILSLQGYEVLTAGSGLEAVRIINRHYVPMIRRSKRLYQALFTLRGK